jgi:hypothetical protein
MVPGKPPLPTRHSGEDSGHLAYSRPVIPSAVAGDYRARAGQSALGVLGEPVVIDARDREAMVGRQHQAEPGAHGDPLQITQPVITIEPARAGRHDIRMEVRRGGSTIVIDKSIFVVPEPSPTQNRDTELVKVRRSKE